MENLKKTLRKQQFALFLFVNFLQGLLQQFNGYLTF